MSGIDVDAAKGAAEARIVLTQGGRLEGSVRRRDGSPIGGAYVNIVSQAPGRSMMSGPGMLVTNAGGGFVAEHVPAGRVTVTLMTWSGSAYINAQGTEVDVREGETTPLELRSRDILVSGRATRAGAPLPGVRITLHGSYTMMMGVGPPDEVSPPPAGPQRMTAVSGEDGGYEMIVDKPFVPYFRSDLEITDRAIQMYNSGQYGAGATPSKSPSTTPPANAPATKPEPAKQPAPTPPAQKK